MKKLLAIVLSLSFVLMVGCSNASSPASGLTEISLSEVTRSVFYAPQYAAIEKGFFEEEGISIDLISGQGADTVMTAVLSGDVEIGLAGPEACIYVYNEGKEDYPVIFAQLTKRDGSFLVANETAAEFSWDNLKGSHLLGGRKGGVPNMVLDYTLTQKGLDTTDDLYMDTATEFSAMAGAFLAGEGDYVALFEPTASMIEMEGKGHIVASIGEESGEIPYTAYFSDSEFMKENPELIQNFTNAIAKGQEWVATASSEDVAKAIAGYFPDTSHEVLVKVVERYRSIDAWNTTPVMKEEALSRLCEVMIAAGELTTPVDFDKVVDNRFANAVS